MAPVQHDPGDAPAAGLHIRAGNNMGRTRDGLLDGALSSIERDGLRHLTMSSICIRSGVAKATLYNHFRTKPDVMAALVAREVDRVAGVALGASRRGDLVEALEAAAASVVSFRPGRQVALDEPGALVALLTVGDGPGWAHARERAAEVLDVDVAHPVVELAILWLASLLLAPSEPQSRRATASLLAAAAVTAGTAATEVTAVTAGTSGTST
jgi:AcrR family transcriptional regulator